MSTFQKMILCGNLGKDPETRYTQSGTAITTFSVATSETWKDKNTGEKKERTTWHNCEAWGRLAEICGEYLRKGSKVLIEGQIRNESWETDSGEKKYMTKVRMDNMVMLGGKQDGDQQRPAQQAPAQQAATSTAAAGGDDFNDDVPF